MTDDQTITVGETGAGDPYTLPVEQLLDPGVHGDVVALDEASATVPTGMG